MQYKPIHLNHALHPVYFLPQPRRLAAPPPAIPGLPAYAISSAAAAVLVYVLQQQEGGRGREPRDAADTPAALTLSLNRSSAV